MNSVRRVALTKRNLFLSATGFASVSEAEDNFNLWKTIDLFSNSLLINTFLA